MSETQVAYLTMDTPSTAPNSAPGSTSTLSLSSNDEQPRIKFLCSFNGSILPRPQDGKLRYVGGETRIVSVPRDITYTELMNRMRDLFEGASVLKYQQPDEDLDALVSVVNDDDVMNMMEEYDKLGSGDGFTRLRIFLFANLEQDGSIHYIDGDDRNSERRYVDALNNMNELSDFRRPQIPESLLVGGFDDIHLSEQYYSPRHSDIPMNLNQLSIPQMGMGIQQPVRYNEMEGTWSPAYYSPRHHGHHEFPSSPSSVRYGFPLGEMSDKGLDRLPDEYAWQQQQQQVNPQSGGHDHHHPHQLPENILWVPTSGSPAGEVGFPGNILNPIDVNNHGRMSFELPHLGNNGLPPELGNPCGVGPTNREGYMLNPNMKMHPRVYNESHPQDRGWAVPPHQMNNPHVEDGRVRLNDYYVRDGPNMNFPMPHSNVVDGPQGGSTSFPQHPELGNEVFHDSTPSHIPLHENMNYAYGVSSPHMVPHGHMHPQTLWRNVPPPFELSRQPQQPMNGATGQNYGHGMIVNPSPPNNYFPENQHPPQSTPIFAPESSNGINAAEEIEKKNLETNGLLDMKPLETLSGNSSTHIQGSGRSSDKVAEPMEPLVDLSDTPQQLNSLKSSPAEDVKAEAEEVHLSADKAATTETEPKEADSPNNQGDLHLESEDTIKSSRIEPTKAEADAIARGLQTIRNDDLEEIRELGSGTYGAVYHGKWRGSDVAIKRIKASCFAGKPSERERLIADFWREASILSSLHHPNVVAFYGIVRDGPDGSLATVTEFMINGSLKQFLQKKDRTIDRRKRLIIAMDSAFGMEYLHGKNIVHFDLKCENLLVNMRDPQRPVCKIGDLGLSKVKQHTLVSGGVRGTLPWMAPELLSGKTNMVSEKIDVYSFGIVMWELLTGEEPYANMHCASIIGGIVNNSLRPEIPTWCDPEWKALMESCWSADPLERPSFSEISQKLRSMAAAINVK